MLNEGDHTGIASHIANESYFRRKPVNWSAISGAIES
jgi:hypothetical protein